MINATNEPVSDSNSEFTTPVSKITYSTYSGQSRLSTGLEHNTPSFSVHYRKKRFLKNPADLDPNELIPYEYTKIVGIHDSVNTIYKAQVLMFIYKIENDPKANALCGVSKQRLLEFGFKKQSLEKILNSFQKHELVTQFYCLYSVTKMGKEIVERLNVEDEFLRGFIKHSATINLQHPKVIRTKEYTKYK